MSHSQASLAVYIKRFLYKEPYKIYYTMVYLSVLCTVTLLLRPSFHKACLRVAAVDVDGGGGEDEEEGEAQAEGDNKTIIKQ